MVMEMDKDDIVSKNIEEKPKKQQIKTKKIKAKVNYSKPLRNVTSVSYEDNGTIFSVFINGIYKKNIEIEYSGNFSNDTIIKVREE